MTPLTDLYNFLTAHWGVFTMALAWAVREWTTVRGWYGLKSWLLTGRVPSDAEAAGSPTSQTSTPAKSGGAVERAAASQP
jgi:hypothetical protein